MTKLEVSCLDLRSPSSMGRTHTNGMSSVSCLLSPVSYLLSPDYCLLSLSRSLHKEL